MTSDKHLRETIGNLHYSRCGFVPTMGALHEGHLALIRKATDLAKPVVVSIFVNPTQFGPGEDYQRYPRTLDADIAAAEQAGADFVFAPAVETVYPGGIPGGALASEEDSGAKGGDGEAAALPEIATKPGLEDMHRPGHFAGVCQVVARLFDLVRPQVAVFGEKDYQQLLVIKAMTAGNQDRWPGLEIVAHPTLREPDGLAMSSRNRFLSPEQRQRALAIPKALRAAKLAPTAATAEAVMFETLDHARLKVDYAVVRNAQSLMPLSGESESARALIAARVDDVRLIDNQSVAIGTSP